MTEKPPITSYCHCPDDTRAAAVVSRQLNVIEVVCDDSRSVTPGSLDRGISEPVRPAEAVTPQEAGGGGREHTRRGNG